MHSEAATIGEIVHPVAGSTARGTVAIVVVSALVGSGTGGNVTTLASFQASLSGSATFATQGAGSIGFYAALGGLITSTGSPTITK